MRPDEPNPLWPDIPWWRKLLALCLFPASAATMALLMLLLSVAWVAAKLVYRVDVAIDGRPNRMSFEEFWECWLGA